MQFRTNPRSSCVQLKPMALYTVLVWHDARESENNHFMRYANGVLSVKKIVEPPIFTKRLAGILSPED